MLIHEQITEGWKAAMRSGDALRKETLSGLRAAIKRAEIDTRGSERAFDANDDAQVQTVIEREAKKRRDAIDEYKKAGREDRAAAESAELEVLQEFLPAQLEEAELRRLVAEAVSESGATSAKDMGAVMKALMPKVAGRADGKQVNVLVREALG